MGNQCVSVVVVVAIIYAIYACVDVGKLMFFLNCFPCKDPFWYTYIDGGNNVAFAADVYLHAARLREIIKPNDALN